MSAVPDPVAGTPATLGVPDLTTWLRRYAAEIVAHEQELTDLDAAIGDGDHGANMTRGMTAVVAVLDQTPFETLDALAKKVGMTLVSSVGGASGPLYGTFWLRFAKPLSGLARTDAATLGLALRAGVEGIQQRGKAEGGDKTMLDAFLPALAAYDAAVDAGAEPTAALRDAATAGRAGCAATVTMVARKGRASYLGERSAGHQDPGATSAALLLECAVS
ncbi:dihydroxyacetone kinase subunit DhaL [Raineyella antarctica]|nr:dihydroxyacetone kinase subunit DhaL [Raineyella antarctica]